jgi:hypothetical protein
MLRPEWRETPLLGDTCRMFRSAATPVPASWRASRIANKSIEFDFSLDSSQPSLGRSRAESRGMELTRRLAAAGVLTGIDVIDHVVLGDVRYWSFKEAGRL